MGKNSCEKRILFAESKAIWAELQSRITSVRVFVSAAYRHLVKDTQWQWPFLILFAFFVQHQIA